jgi:hypothetical protein
VREGRWRWKLESGTRIYWKTYHHCRWRCWSRSRTKSAPWATGEDEGKTTIRILLKQNSKLKDQIYKGGGKKN